MGELAEVTPVDRADAGRARSRWVYGGFGLGVAVGLGAAAVQVAVSGWGVLPFMLLWNLISLPCLGAAVGFGRWYRSAGPDRPPWRGLRTRTLMLLVAYSALLCGLGVSTSRLGRVARHYQSKAYGSDSWVQVFSFITRNAERDARQKRESVRLLRAGKVPETLTQGQKDFLRSLDRTATPEYRKYRYGLIADTEEWLGRLAEYNLAQSRPQLAYHKALAAKYHRARWRPWLPVAPDPPPPTPSGPPPAPPFAGPPPGRGVKG